MASPVHSASVHPARDTLVWGGADFLVHVLDFATGREREAYKVGGFPFPPHLVMLVPRPP